MDKYFIKLVKSFLNDKKHQDGRTFVDFKKWILWNPDYGYITYNYVRNYKETEYNETLKAVQNENK